MFDIESNLSNLPNEPGVYLHKDKYGDVIYVGKATSLRNRVKQYFRSPAKLDDKTRTLVANIEEFEYIVTGTESEALLLENTLIKKYQPRYNVMLRDDKTYPYIRVTLGEKYPRMVKTRVIFNDGSKYFGPYADVSALNHIVDLLNDIYKLKRCNKQEFSENHRPCLNGFIGACDKCCLNEISEEEYSVRISDAMDFLKGKSHSVMEMLNKEMKAASENMNFEDAARYRDLVISAKTVTERQKVDLLSSGNMDILIASAPASERMARVAVFFVRDGRLTGREIHNLDADAGSEKAEIIEAFLKQYYANQTMIPKEILLEEHVEDESSIEDYLSAAKGSKVTLSVPVKGKKYELLKLAVHDMKESEELLSNMLESRKEKEEDANNALLQIIEEISGVKIKLEDSDNKIRIEAYDISNTGGHDTVGAMVVFLGHVRQVKDYRKFKVRSEDGSDDYGSMQEVLYRRFRRGINGEKGFEKLPNAILIDGGKGHVSAAQKVMNAMKLEIPILGMVKDDKHRTRGLIAGDNEINLTEYPNLYHLIGTIQEEVHRFVIEYHRSLRKRNAIVSELDEIAGIGEKRRNSLLIKFGSIDAIKQATFEELMETPGITSAVAEKVIAHFQGAESQG